jgi:hypothetical protein
MSFMFSLIKTFMLLEGNISFFTHTHIPLYICFSHFPSACLVCLGDTPQVLIPTKWETLGICRTKAAFFLNLSPPGLNVESNKNTADVW